MTDYGSTRRHITSGSDFEQQIGYSRAVVDGDWIFVSGCTGFDYATGEISPDVVDQAEQCLRNIVSALSLADAKLSDVVRVRYILSDRSDFKRTWPVLQRWLGHIRPAATMWVAGMAVEAMKIEIEVTARRQKSAAMTVDVKELAMGEISTTHGSGRVLESTTQP